MANLNGLEDALCDLLKATVHELKARVSSGSASPTDISNVIKLCRDNGITLDASDTENGLSSILSSITEEDMNAALGGLPTVSSTKTN